MKNGTPVEREIDCGDLSVDFNKDCYVGLEDLTYIVDEWLECTDPAVVDCDQYWQ